MTPKDKLPWTRYKYVAESKGTRVYGVMELTYYPTRAQVSSVALARVTQTVQEAKEPWDPFNCELVVVRVRETLGNYLSKKDFQTFVEETFNGIIKDPPEWDGTSS